MCQIKDKFDTCQSILCSARKCYAIERTIDITNIILNTVTKSENYQKRNSLDVD